jgi:hypothetical protein
MCARHSANIAVLTDTAIYVGNAFVVSVCIGSNVPPSTHLHRQFGWHD